VLIKNVTTVREAFMKHSISEVLPESKATLDLLSPKGLLEGLRDLNINELSDLEIGCLMRVLAKPELGNAIILNEFALIMENFGVPLVDATISDEEDYCPEGQEKPTPYNLANIDTEGLEILSQVAKYLLQEYMHPREFFQKSIKNNVEVHAGPKSYRVDTLNINDFYFKCKVANIRKTLDQN
jgi:hypothetical protein